MGQGDLVWQVRDKPWPHRWDKERHVGSENNPKTGTDQTFRNILVARDQGVSWDLEPNAPRRGRRKKHLTLAPALPPSHENQTEDKSSSSIDSSSSLSSSTRAPSGLPQHAKTQAQAQTNPRDQQKKEMAAKVHVMPTPTVLPTATPRAQLKSTSSTKRAVVPTMLDVPPQAKHPRCEANGRTKYDGGCN